MNHFGIWLKRKQVQLGGAAAAFVTATLVYVVGGQYYQASTDLGKYHTVLLAKALIDGVLIFS